MKKEELICIFSRKIRSILERSAADFLFIEEIRLRVGQPLCICRGRGEEYLTPSGRIFMLLRRSSVRGSSPYPEVTGWDWRERQWSRVETSEGLSTYLF